MKWLASFFLILSLAFLTPVPLSFAAPVPPVQSTASDCHDHAAPAPAKTTLPAADHACCPSVAAIHSAVVPALRAPDTHRVVLPVLTAQLRDGHPHDVFHPPRV